MKQSHIITVLLFLLLTTLSSPAVEKQRNIYRVFITNNEQMHVLRSQDVDIVATSYGTSIDIQCSEKQAEKIASLGFKIEMIMTEAEAMAMLDVPDGFHNYEQTRAFLHNIVDNYPTIAFLDSIGASIENRGLWALKISDNPTSDEDEPCFLVEGCIHGNENHSLEVCLFFIQYLVENYSNDKEVTHWVDNREIWIVPLVNPDGHERNVRLNANNVDLNRNFGFWWGFAASSYGTAPFSEPETQAIRDLAIAIKPYGSLAFHTSGRVILYPWAYNSEPGTPDDALFVATANEMVDSINTVDPQIQYYTRRSGTWYWHGGEHNDWTYSQYGMHSFTIELMTSQSAPPSDHENEVVLPAFRVMLRRPDKSGITGLITDAGTGGPLSARVKIFELFDENQLRPRTAEPLFGRYHRFLVPGFYTLEIYKPGYRREISQIVIHQGDPIRTINFQMVKAADIVFTDCIIDDDYCGQSQGNGNCLYNQGETIEFGVYAQNIGDFNAQHVYGKLKTDCEFITVIQDSAYFGDIDSAANIYSTNKFLFGINSNVRPGAKFKMQIDFYDDSGNHWESDFYQRIQGFFDDMEIEGRDQWTHDFMSGAVNPQDDWQYGIPYGKGGDPNSAHSPEFVWGNDLGPSGWNGLYQNNVHNFLQMRTLNCSGWNHVYLQFYRCLNISAGDQAYIRVNNYPVWNNNNVQISDSNWRWQILDIASVAADNDSVVIQFSLRTNGSGTSGGWTIDDVIVAPEILLHVQDKKPLSQPDEFCLYQNYPNPFNTSTTIRFDLPELQHVTLAIFNLLGQKVKTIISSKLPAGNYHFSWNGENDGNIPVTSGVYFIKLFTGDGQLTRKLLLLR